jgi:hypothetical protein
MYTNACMLHADVHVHTCTDFFYLHQRNLWSHCWGTHIPPQHVAVSQIQSSHMHFQLGLQLRHHTHRKPLDLATPRRIRVPAGRPASNRTDISSCWATHFPFTTTDVIGELLQLQHLLTLHVPEGTGGQTSVGDSEAPAANGYIYIYVCIYICIHINIHICTHADWCFWNICTWSILSKELPYNRQSSVVFTHIQSTIAVWCPTYCARDNACECHVCLSLL